MPTYVVECQNKKCEFQEEILCSYEKMQKHKCTKCKSKTKQIYTNLNFVLKGDGFHSTNQDYFSKKKKMDRLKYVSED